MGHSVPPARPACTPLYTNTRSFDVSRPCTAAQLVFQFLAFANPTATNILELRLDAYKFTFATRRPSFEGADGIGSWKYVMQAYSWCALVINVLVVAYASNGVRDWIIAPAQATHWECEDASLTEFLGPFHTQRGIVQTEEEHLSAGARRWVKDVVHVTGNACQTTHRR